MSKEPQPPARPVKTRLRTRLTSLLVLTLGLACPPGVLVFLGGGAGGLARYSLTLLYPASSLTWGGVSLPVGEVLANLLACLALGLLTGLLLAWPARQLGERVRLLLATGFLGGLSSYSALALTSAHSLLAGDYPSLLVYLSISLLASYLLASLGLWVGRGLAATFFARTSPSRARGHR